jgi:hypothetical protein
MDTTLLALLGMGGGDSLGVGLTPDAIQQALAKDEKEQQARYMMNFGAALASGRGGGNLLSGLGNAALTANEQASKDEGRAIKKLLTTTQLTGAVNKQAQATRQIQNRFSTLKAKYPNVADEQLMAAAQDDNWREILNPKLESIFDEQGKEVKGIRNPFDGSFVREGGAKSDILSPEELAQQIQLRQAGRDSVNVDLSKGPQFGNIPPGYMLQQGPDGYQMVPVAGSPAAQAGEKGKVQQGRAADLVSQEVGRALTEMKSATLPTTGLVGDYLSSIGGTAAHNVRELVKTIEAEAAFGRLQQMRESSPTGGALGQVTERELALLTAALGSLKQSQSADQFRDNLMRVNNVYNDIVHGAGNGPKRYELSFEKPAPPPAAAQEPADDEAAALEAEARRRGLIK